jgi:hypothetical protein
MSISVSSPRSSSAEELATLMPACDHVLKECGDYVAELSKNKPIVQTITSMMPSTVNNYIEKRKDARMNEKLEDLQSKIQKCEEGLRQALNELINDKTELKDAGHMLYKELDKTMDMTKTRIAQSLSVEDSVREIVDIIAQETADLKAMIAFNKEITQQKEFENAFYQNGGNTGSHKSSKFNNRRSSAYSDDTYRMYSFDEDATMNTIATEDMESNTENSEIVSRLVSLRKSRDEMIASLTFVLEEKGSLDVLLVDCQKSIDYFDGVFHLKKGNKSPEKEGVLQDEQEGEEDVLKYTESVLKKCKDCQSEIQCIQDNIDETNEKLQSLVLYREDLNG